MIAGFCFFAVSLLFSGCKGSFGIDEPKYDIENHGYMGDPVEISCVYDGSMIGFYQEKINGTSEVSTTLVGRLNNGKPLSLYFDGIFSHVSPKGATFKFVKEWHNASSSNICYLTYAFEKIPEHPVKKFLYIRKMIIARRLKFAAKVAHDLVLNIRDRCLKSGGHGCWTNMSQVTAVGFSYGAHVASQTCVDLYQSTGQKVGKLIGLDPAGIYLFLKIFKQSFINRGQADYVQIVHSDPYFFGTMFQRGDVDIYVKDIPISIFKKHGVVAYFHMATSMKKLLLIAEKDGKGQVIQVDEHPEQKYRVPNKDEVFVGVYDVVDESKRGQKFYISFKNHFELLGDSIAHVVKMQLR